jgi:hypothetical protein
MIITNLIQNRNKHLRKEFGEERRVTLMVLRLTFGLPAEQVSYAHTRARPTGWIRLRLRLRLRL